MTIEPVEITLYGPGKNALGSSLMDFFIDGLAAANGAPVLLAGAGDARWRPSPSRPTSPPAAAACSPSVTADPCHRIRMADPRRIRAGGP